MFSKKKMEYIRTSSIIPTSPYLDKKIYSYQSTLGFSIQDYIVVCRHKQKEKNIFRSIRKKSIETLSENIKKNITEIIKYIDTALYLVNTEKSNVINTTVKISIYHRFSGKLFSFDVNIPDIQKKNDIKYITKDINGVEVGCALFLNSNERKTETPRFVYIYSMYVFLNESKFVLYS